MLLLARTTPREQVAKHDRRPVGVPRRYAAALRPRPDDQADPHDDEPRDDRAVLRRSARAGRQPGRRGGQGLPLHPRRHERRAHPDRGGVHRRCRWFIEKATAYATERKVFGRPIGQNQGVQFPIARAYAQMPRPLMVHKAAALFDAGEQVRRGGQHGQDARVRGVAGRRPTSASRPTAASASPRNTTSSASSARRGSTRWRRSRPT